MGITSETPYEVVELTAEEVDEVRDLWATLLEHHQEVAAHLAPLGRRLTSGESWAIRRAQYLEWLASGSARLWVARSGVGSRGAGAPIAYCFVRVAERSGSWDWGTNPGVLETLVVGESARGTGLGTRLLNKAQAYFRESGAQVLKVSVVAGNEDAIRLYRRHGAVDQLLTLVMPIAIEEAE